MMDSNSNLISEQDSPQQSGATPCLPGSDQLALPLTATERAASWRQVNKLHPANRFRLMFGQPLLPEGQKNGMSQS
jgi:hypothetical protein